MKKRYTSIILLLTCLSIQAFSQVLNDAQTLRDGITSIYAAGERINSSEHFVGGIDFGISRRADIETRFRVGPNIMRISINAEYALAHKPNISVSLGGHYQKKSSGADATLNISFPISRFFNVYTGVDTDINFSGGTTSTPAWGFVGLNTFFFRSLEFYLEYNPPITSSASLLLGSGLRIYF